MQKVAVSQSPTTRWLNMSIFVGVDGGGTKTKAVAIDQSKVIVGSSETGSTNQNSVGKDAAKANLHAAISAAVSAAGRQMGDIACLCLSMSGVDCPADEELCMFLSRIYIMLRYSIANEDFSSHRRVCSWCSSRSPVDGRAAAGAAGGGRARLQ